MSDQAPSPVIPINPAVPAKPTNPPVAPIRLVPGQLHQQVNAVLAVRTPVGKYNVQNADELTSPRFRCLLYGDTDALKTTTAARFAGPDDVRIILVRNEAQMIALRGLGYKYYFAPDVDKATFALQFPEKVFGMEWAARPDATLILDDVTYLKDMSVEDNETRTVGQHTVDVKDARQVYKAVLKDIGWDSFCRGILLKNFHFIAIALASSYKPLPNEERVEPDLPPKMRQLLKTDFEHVLYIQKSESRKDYRLLTQDTYERVVMTNEKGMAVPYKRIIVAKHKLPVLVADQGIIKPVEPLDLRAFWAKIRDAEIGKAGV